MRNKWMNIGKVTVTESSDGSGTNERKDINIRTQMRVVGEVDYRWERIGRIAKGMWTILHRQQATRRTWEVLNFHRKRIFEKEYVQKLRSNEWYALQIHVSLQFTNPTANARVVRTIEESDLRCKKVNQTYQTESEPKVTRKWRNVMAKVYCNKILI